MLGLRKSDLVAVRIPPGPAWIDGLSAIWESGAAALPIDHRLPDMAAADLMQRMRPTVVMDGDGVSRVEGTAIHDDVAVVVATSGTSGTPKGVELTLDAVRAAVDASTQRLVVSSDDAWLACLPFAHIGGLLVLARSILTGAPVVVHERFDVDAFARARDVRFTSLVPTMVRRLVDAGVDLTYLRAILVGGAGCDDEVRSRAPIVTTYGMSESCGGVVYDGVPFDGTEVKIEHDGQILLRGPTLMRVYRLDPEATRAAFTDDGWFRTCDAGAIDSGRLRVFGRVDDVINTGGEKVWPDAVEDALRAHPGVRDVAVAGRPDAEWGQVVTAFVVPGDQAPSLDALREHVASVLPRYAAPRALVLVDAVPRTPGGKVMRAALRNP